MRFYRLLARNTEGATIWQQITSDQKALDVLHTEQAQGEAVYIRLTRHNRFVLESIKHDDGRWSYIIW